MPRFPTLDDIDVRGKRVLLRADLNVPVKDGKVTDATRIERLAPTIEALLGKGAAVVVMSHFGRPKGRPDPELSLRPVIAPLRQALGGRKIAFAEDCIGEPARRVVATLKPGEVALLENLRFHPGEEANSPDFAKALAELGEVYVDDAFSAAHRAHASIAALAHLLPAAAGKLMEAELEALTAALEHPARPVVALIGGAKVSTKLDLLRFIIGKVDVLAIGGAMANTMLFAQGVDVGHSLCEREMTQGGASDPGSRGRTPLPGDPARGRRRRRRAVAHRAGAHGGDRCGRRRHDDPRHRPGDVGAHRCGARRGAHLGLERAARRLRDAAVRPRHRGGGEKGRRTHPSGPAAQRCWRRRYGGRPRRGRGERCSFPMSRPRAALFSNGWKGASCRASPLWPAMRGGIDPRRIARHSRAATGESTCRPRML